ncbi:hypothetical protein HYPSUDRAFT_44711 [Hypholoma sublateritium FD-334 SS-4]|uniref:F-box domain-containing protein n=1 Tax=Hypholoma sublateritium (strain FD-334 SS-4) TaxID=945553 RepID=A0A0D2NQJ9_HYPSF|nr:hypothetical protein HYPSUDRAFT_44711 [Hypholoma sublateritium FD-334 SS-4]
MDQAALSSKSVLETLVKTNRPPTDQETAIIRESMAPTNAELKVVEAQISETMAHIQELKSQVEQAETKLQRLREEEAAILETFADHRRVFSPFRNIPEDIIREICIQACVKGDIPKLSYPRNPSTYILAQICSGMRHIALTTPIIWASVHVEIRSYLFSGLIQYEKAYSALARRVSAWFQRAGGLGLTVSIEDSNIAYAVLEGFQSDPSTILFDALLSYSTRWKQLQFDSSCGSLLSPLILRIAALTAVDLPLLRSVSFHLDCVNPDPPIDDSVLLKIPTLKRIKLETRNIRMFAVDWAILTSVTLHGESSSSSVYLPIIEVARILQQTKCLVFCDIAVRPSGLQEHYSNNINLPFLKTLIVGEKTPASATSGAPSILDLITAPILEVFDMRREAFLDLSGFFKRSPRIRKLFLPYFDKDTLFTETVGFLSHCPSLTDLSLFSCNWNNNTVDANGFLRAFVEGDTGVICPCLQDFQLIGMIDFSLQTLRLFLAGRQGDISALNGMPWKKLAIDTRGIKNTKRRQQVLDLLQKNAAGSDIQVSKARYGYY